MALANASYQELRSLSDGPDLLNLAWTLDERRFLSIDLSSLMGAELLAEQEAGLPYVHGYFVQDPYGDKELGPAVAQLFGRADWACDTTCGAGVISLLYALSQLAEGRPVYITGDVYPDLPHWIEQSGGRCVSRFAEGLTGDRAVDQIRALGCRLILVERPSLVNAVGPANDVEDLRELCEAVAAQGAVVVVDESYANYCPPSFSSSVLVEELANLVVLRGLSKAYGMGGLRLAYAVSHPALTPRVRAVVPPMLASSLSLRMGAAVLSLGDATSPLRQRVQAGKAEMTRLLTAAGLPPADLSHPHVPYVMYDEQDVAARQHLEGRGIMGKLQPLWSERALGIAHKYRVSVPLSDERMAEFRQRLG
ncbi:aminotransferase class I/II-fold pyridoxal phosphate-dependent enzyme [Streptacidiphilus sp. P02-A3a]|uniref:aminotransferase class I/II-fold pyridoxal phosphate-dependent enzyme n=1 Tax=Streptacidiphilus sp. P02-A3a TaxID=2704468 RepID=UPI0015FC7247|nr:aminotransferase class I/II-fold pyridoxal phosphate-dependent enzyme [Streptacidiphilus sp. P02-A3a]QMU71824.1 aminotransferase class I/II-fold pyridoxal phosphate-dependent enzyme [Streptacidiphilus sp. P02-A3a]